MSSTSTPESKGVVDSFNTMNPNAKILTLIVGGFVITIGLAIAIIIIAIIILVGAEVSNCSTMNTALVTLWIILGALFLSSVALIELAAWKIYPGCGGRLAVLAAYGIVSLVSYVVLGFGLMILFNC
jgi:hypothetical protein